MLPALAAAVTLKYAPLLPAPAALVYVFKKGGWKAGLLGCLLAALFLAERHRLRRLTLLITTAQTLSLTFFKQAYILNYFAMIFLPAAFVFRQERRSGSLGQKELTTETQRHSPEQ